MEKGEHCCAVVLEQWLGRTEWQCHGGDAGVEPALGGKRDQGTVEQDHPALFPS